MIALLMIKQWLWNSKLVWDGNSQNFKTSFNLLHKFFSIKITLVRSCWFWDYRNYFCTSFLTARLCHYKEYYRKREKFGKFWLLYIVNKNRICFYIFVKNWRMSPAAGLSTLELFWMLLLSWGFLHL